MSRRERLERRADKREQWAGTRTAKAAAAFQRSRLDEETTGIPLGQPILVGHHSEGRHRRVIERARAALGHAVEHGRKAEEHASAASTIRARLDHSIFSDDADAIEALERRAAQHDAEAEQANAINRAWRKGFARGGIEAATAELVAMGLDAAHVSRLLRTMALCPWLKAPESTTHPRAAARRDRQRIEEIRRDASSRQQRADDVATVDGPAISDRAQGWAVVSFPAPPDRAIRRALRDAGWVFSAGGWHGRRDTLPPSVAAVVRQVKASPSPTDAPGTTIETTTTRSDATIIEQRDRLVAAMLANPSRNPNVVLRDADADAAALPVWSGSLADFLALQEVDDLRAWEIASWRCVRDLSLSRRVLLYLRADDGATLGVLGLA